MRPEQHHLAESHTYGCTEREPISAKHAARVWAARVGALVPALAIHRERQVQQQVEAQQVEARLVGRWAPSAVEPAAEN